MFYKINNTNNRKKELFIRIKKYIPFIVNFSLKEDLGGVINIESDITTKLISENSKSNAVIITRDNGIFCGKNWFQEVFKQLGNNVSINWQVADGDVIEANQILCTLYGPTRILLIGERTALNFIQTMSGVASQVKYYSDLLYQTNTKLLDTRKTLPGLRTALKYAVLCGGGNNHRLDLTDAFLIKDNHIIAAGSITNAVAQAKIISTSIPIEVEVKNFKELVEALAAQVDIIMLDNFSNQNISQAIAINKQQAALEISGNITLNNIKEYALMGIDYISVGALTKNVRALDLTMYLQ
ncbi:carboxylating nicotinate-nucleotide diphosphorylase [Candidatus Palibaumannia cicadellinicola]|uniref:nicotinate-nucleotide diphosphorylase (carboxylating) n=1 Tax=Candidatus Palibaumannia cicadellinicola TaxID=186490 RepID=A0A0K2BKZ2_9GAMM|nr:carboxylating nicotinate-nucleotide diphosphorylase [Candidatus Baumannia cicadellinicola]AKZ66041.1 Quinolinate phosphoribosyltransferase [Candidatus Baumannia cicadellinicola]